MSWIFDFAASFRVQCMIMVIPPPDNKHHPKPTGDHSSSGEEQWQQAFQKSKAAALHALGIQDTQKVMGIVFDRLYTLRNQLLHGGATWNSNINRSQISQGAEIMGQVVPIVIHRFSLLGGLSILSQ